MRISLRQKGGITGADDQIELDDTALSVARRGEPIRRRRLTPLERTKVSAAAKDLLASSVPAAPSDEVASDSMLTQIDIDHRGSQHTFAVRSGQDAPPALWDLVDALSDAAKPG